MFHISLLRRMTAFVALQRLSRQSSRSPSESEHGEVMRECLSCLLHHGYTNAEVAEKGLLLLKALDNNETASMQIANSPVLLDHDEAGANKAINLALKSKAKIGMIRGLDVVVDVCRCQETNYRVRELCCRLLANFALLGPEYCTRLVNAEILGDSNIFSLLVGMISTPSRLSLDGACWVITAFQNILLSSSHSLNVTEKLIETSAKVDETLAAFIEYQLLLAKTQDASVTIDRSALTVDGALTILATLCAHPCKDNLNGFQYRFQEAPFVVIEAALHTLFTFSWRAKMTDRQQAFYSLSHKAWEVLHLISKHPPNIPVILRVLSGAQQGEESDNLEDVLTTHREQQVENTATLAKGLAVLFRAYRDGIASSADELLPLELAVQSSLNTLCLWTSCEDGRMASSTSELRLGLSTDSFTQIVLEIAMQLKRHESDSLSTKDSILTSCFSFLGNMCRSDPFVSGSSVQTFLAEVLRNTTAMLQLDESTANPEILSRVLACRTKPALTVLWNVLSEVVISCSSISSVKRASKTGETTEVYRSMESVLQTVIDLDHVKTVDSLCKALDAFVVEAEKNSSTQSINVVTQTRDTYELASKVKQKLTALIVEPKFAFDEAAAASSHSSQS